MSTTASGLILGFLLSTIYGAGFHFIVGGRPRKIILYLGASWFGFAIGHFVGDLIGFELLKLGVIHLFAASIGSWLTLVLVWYFSSPSRS